MPQRIACKYGSCTSKQNSTNRQVNGAPGVRFIKFPSVKKETEKCQRWVQACGRNDFQISDVSRGTYICSRHFHDLNGPTEENPDPISLASLRNPNKEITVAMKPEENLQLKELNIIDENNSKSNLELGALSPPSGWSMETLEDGVVFMKHINRHIVLSCKFVSSELSSVIITALDKNIPLNRIENNLQIGENTTNDDIYNFLSRMNHFKICPGNNDEDLIKLYKARQPNKHRTSSYYSEHLKTIYSDKCQALIPVYKKRCIACHLYRSSLRTLRLRSKTLTKSVSYQIDSKIRHPKKKFKTNLILSNKGKKERDALKQVFKEKMKNETPGSFMSIFIKQQLRALERSKYGMRWDSFFLKWCSYMKNKSKSAYETLKKSGIVILPTTRTLYKHDHTLKNTSGFQEDVFNEMVELTDLDNLPEHQKYFALLLDEMTIKPDVICHKDTGCLTGFIDVDEHHNTLDDIELKVKGTTSPPLATSILQLMLRGITTNIKIPFAHFPTKGATSGELYSIIWEAISLLENSGFRILAVVGDGASTNRKFFRMCTSNEKNSPPYVTPNLHAADEERDIFFLSDAPHLIKTVRNCISNSGAHSKSRSMWKNGEDLSWKVILRLYYTQLRMKGQFKNASKLTYGHVFLNGYSKMKVNLATQVMSETVASAIETLFGNEKYPETVKFIRVFDKFFDLCNVKNCNESLRKRKPNKRAYENEDDERLKWLEGDFINYLEDWEKDVENRPGTFSKEEKNRMLLSKETIEGLRMTALSTVAIVKYLLKKGAKYVLTQHLNQDPLEQYFGRQRCSGGRNCNPSVALFEANMDKLKALTGLALEAVNGNTSMSDKLDN